METEKVNSNNTQEIQNDDSTKNETGRDQDTNLGEYLPKLFGSKSGQEMSWTSYCNRPVAASNSYPCCEKKNCSFSFLFFRSLSFFSTAASLSLLIWPEALFTSLLPQPFHSARQPKTLISLTFSFSRFLQPSPSVLLSLSCRFSAVPFSHEALKLSAVHSQSSCPPLTEALFFGYPSYLSS